jgi:deoxyribodipyrimidine photolyase
MHEKAFYLFYLDLRVDDNVPLQECLRDSVSVYPIFIYDEQSHNDTYNKFLKKSLYDLDNQLHDVNPCCHLIVIRKLSDIIKISKKHGIHALYVGDYCKTTQTSMISICNANKISFNQVPNNGLLPREHYNSFSGRFKAYYKHIMMSGTLVPSYYTDSNFASSEQNINIIGDVSNNLGGRAAVIELLKNCSEINSILPFMNHLYFGTVSVRELYQIFRTRVKNGKIILDLLHYDFLKYK